MTSIQEAIDNFKKLGTDPDEVDLFTEIGRLDLLIEGKFVTVANGIIRILKHKQTNMCRVVMRKNNTYETILNHYITPSIYLYPNQIRWKCDDYSSNEKVSKDVMVVFPKARTGANEKFRESFNIARRINDYLINGENNAYLVIQRCIFDMNTYVFQKEKYIKFFSQNIHMFIAEESFFTLPVDIIVESIETSKYKFDFNECKRIASLTDAAHSDGSSVALLKVMSITDIYECLSVISSMKNVPVLNAISNKTEPMLEQINFEDSKKIIDDLQPLVEGTPVISIICSLKIGEKIIPVMASITKSDTGNKLVCISTDDKSIVLKQPITESTHLWPELVQWTYEDEEYRLIIQPFNKSDEAKFRETHYRAKYNLWD